LIYGEIDCVVKGGAAACPDLTNLIGELFRIIGKVLKKVDARIKADDECLVFAALQSRIKELDSRFFLKSQFIPYAAACVHEKCNGQR
jgi:hypothetical protein